jgi:hypothetical protein
VVFGYETARIFLQRPLPNRARFAQWKQFAMSRSTIKMIGQLLDRPCSKAVVEFAIASVMRNICSATSNALPRDEFLHLRPTNLTQYLLRGDLLWHVKEIGFYAREIATEIVNRFRRSCASALAPFDLRHERRAHDSNSIPPRQVNEQPAFRTPISLWIRPGLNVPCFFTLHPHPRLSDKSIPPGKQPAFAVLIANEFFHPPVCARRARRQLDCSKEGRGRNSHLSNDKELFTCKRGPTN